MCLLAAMKLLLAAATAAEISPLLAHLQKLWQQENPLSFTKDGNEICICVTGVGMMAATYALTKMPGLSSFDFALQTGVAGSFSRDIPLGEAVFITSDRYGDLGAEDHYNFIDIFELGLLALNEKPFSGVELLTPPHPLHDHILLKKVNGLTVNTVSGSDFTIKSRTERYACIVESMEGAAFHYVCLQENIPFAQVRTISNYVTPRDKESWKMMEAIINLNKWLIDFIETL
jgi:futalosine hydrolase